MKIAVLISGGVDSAIALAQLVQAGYRPTAFYLKIWLEDELAYLGQCPWQEDLAYAQQVCAQFGVPLEVVNLQRAYWDIVVQQTIARIQAGKTPNPDILCNQYVKFGAFVTQTGADWDYVATGHYARIVHEEPLSRLWLTPDPIKDQTYFLARLQQAQLRKALFPLGEFTKTAVRARAQELAIANALRKDSQGICFLGKLSFRDFIRHHLGTQTGPFIDAESGREVGSHEGYWFYTIGQRQGIGLSGGPWYVVAKDTRNNRVIISKQYYDVHYDRSQVILEDLHWLAHPRMDLTTCQVKMRHGPAMTQATIRHVGDRMCLTLAARDQGIAPGQYAVLYDGQECIASGIMSEQVDVPEVGT